MFRLDLITLFAAFGAFQGILFSIILWFRKKSRQSNKVFALLLFVTSIRIAKNIVVHARELDPDFEMSHSTWRFLVNVGLTHQFAIGPLLLLFFLTRSNIRFTITKKHLLHFLPYLLLLTTSPFQPWKFWSEGGLLASYISILWYYLWSIHVYLKASRLKNSDDGVKWLRTVAIICGVLLLAYSPALFKYIGYIGGAVLYAIGVYFVSIMVFGRDRFVAYFQSKYPGSSLDTEQARVLIQKIEAIVVSQSRYLDSKLSLSILAKELEVSANALSQVINSHYQKSFTDFINQYRVEKAKAMLTDKDHMNDKIVAIAFDCGFNSLSTFNTVFKKNVGIAPNEYRKTHSRHK